MPKLWVQYWEESERGWGTRPDGCYVYPTKEKAEEETLRIEKEMREREMKGKPKGWVPDEYSRPCGKPQLKDVSDKIAEEVKAKGVWINHWNWRLDYKETTK